MIMNVIIEDESGNAPNQADLQAWSNNFGLTMPVLADPNYRVLSSYATSSSIGLPFTVLIDRGVVVESVDYPTVDDAVRLLRAR